jgi:hypothetical protein
LYFVWRNFEISEQFRLQLILYSRFISLPEEVRFVLFFQMKLQDSSQENTTLSRKKSFYERKDPSSIAITLRFVEERSGGTGMPIEVVLPAAASWDEVCRRLRTALRRVAIFRCSDGRQGWREVRCAKTYADFRETIARDFIPNSSNSALVETHLIPIGAGALPLWSSEEACSIAGSGAGGPLANIVLRERMLLTRCVDKAIEGGGSGSDAEKKAAGEARRLVELAEAAAAVGPSAQREEVKHAEFLISNEIQSQRICVMTLMPSNLHHG